MKHHLLFLLNLISFQIFAQSDAEIRQITYSDENSALLFNPSLKPFYHGVASGDPTQDGVVIWTRVTPENPNDLISVQYQVSKSLSFNEIVASGVVNTNADRDFTVKKDLSGLEPFTHYYYRFMVGNDTSLIGRTKTAPQDLVDNIRFGVVSCSNFQAGYFNAYGFANQRNDIDYMLHLGDYIYEYGEGGYGYNDETQRGHEPNHEMVVLEDYRLRYSFYRLDTNLMRLHQLYPMISTWDDHESTNDSYKDGAQNHTEGDEGIWEERKLDAATAYSEWMPIRNPDPNNPIKIWRTLGFGDLLDLIMIDTRIWGRDKQVSSVNDAEYANPDRTILGKDQYKWFVNELKSSKAQWKIIGNQVQVMLVQTAPGQPLLLDPWDGYPAERDSVLRYIRDNEIDNVVVLTGDIHTTWAADLALDPFTLNTPFNPDGYTALTQTGSVATEFVTPSVTSDNFNEITGTPAGSSAALEAGLMQTNGHIRYVELDDHGYMVFDVNQERVQAQWYTGEILEVDTTPTLLKAMKSDANSNRVSAVNSNFTDEKDNGEKPFAKNVLTSIVENSPFVQVLGAFPNPATDYVKIQFGLNARGSFAMDLIDIQGKSVWNSTKRDYNTGIYEITISVKNLKPGHYYFRLSGKDADFSYQVVKK